MAELIGAPFGHLLRRMLRELEHEDKAFDLPARRFWRGFDGLDLSVRFHGAPAAHPLGPAAGPHAQMAQNLVLAWLAGSRILELKTVQIDDRLTIPRPCIDATTVGFNVEWSQELRLHESLREYVAGSMLIDVLRQHAGLGLAPGADATILDMSVGYDLAGIRSEPVRGWIEAMRDARPQVEALRGQIPDDLRRLREVEFTTRLSDQITLSTFHGCPASEIESIARFLLEDVGVHVTVKLNPTLLGRETVDGLLRDQLGYAEIRTRPEDFAADLQWSQALEITDRLCEVARSLGRRFQVKLSNTLVVENHRDFFPATETVQYLSGQPLHVLTTTLAERFRAARPDVPISFSAGVDNRNFPDCVAAGFVPVTTCTDLLRPGGYARLPAYLDRLADRMRALGVRRIGDFVILACGHGARAVSDVVSDPELAGRIVASFETGSVDVQGLLHAAGHAELYEPVVARAAALNLPGIAQAVRDDPRYRAEQNRREPRKLGTRLALFDCVNCDKCLPVCPNDANFVYESPAVAVDYRVYRVEAGTIRERPGGRFETRGAHQIATFQDFCNECGNCDTFCPEDGGPYLEKPRLFGSREAWERFAELDGFFLDRDGHTDRAWCRLQGKPYRLEVDRATDRARFADAGVEIELRHSERRVVSARALEGAADGHELDLSAYLSSALVLDGVLDARRANPVTAALP